MALTKSIIAWTTRTWNPTFGCSHVSEGCRNCYAEQLSLKFGWSKQPWTAPHAAENVKVRPERLREPDKLKEPSRIFVNSMSDLFHPLIPDTFRAQVFDTMARANQHTYQVLTKRPELAAKWAGPWLANIWMGASVEDARNAHRIAQLRDCPAQVRFLSIEPLIAPVGNMDLTGIHWVIVGGESGPHYRPMDHAWARDIRDQCVAAGVAFFFKQSAARFTERGTALIEEDGSAWEWRQFPGEFTPPRQVRAAA